ncbi:MAG: MarR family transcriptional regulator [Erysipelotrichaceae bacterium]|nr:MarR family transcriptional regulator [Erysipelotrichaceae bacterium]
MRTSEQIKEIISSQSGEDLVLMTLKRYGSLNPSEIGKITMMSSAHIAKTIGQLRCKNLISRIRDDGDRRKATVCLSSTGAEKAVEIETKILKAISSLLGNLEESELKELLRIFSKINGSEVAG